MATFVEINDNHTGYVDILRTLFQQGTVQKSRNGDTIELEDLVIEVKDPTITSLNGVRKFYGPEIGLVEGLQLIAGVSDSALTAQIQPNFRNYMEDDTGKFWGAYGPRMREQMPIILERLRDDPDTRQAVITLWDPAFDAMGGKKDHPCTSLFNFRIRDGKLNMSTYMRSNDAIYGWPFDLIQFSMLMQSMAWALRVEVGTYTHHVGSFHIYEPHWEIGKEIVRNYDKGDMLPIPFFKGFAQPSFIGPTDGHSWEDIRRRAEITLRVVTQTLPWSELETFDEKSIAVDLLDRRAQQLAKTLGSIK